MAVQGLCFRAAPDLSVGVIPLCSSVIMMDSVEELQCVRYRTKHDMV